MPPSDERCHYYDEDGNPSRYRNLAHHPKYCRFSHPYDRTWASATPARTKQPRPPRSPPRRRSPSPARSNTSVPASPAMAMHPSRVALLQTASPMPPPAPPPPAVPPPSAPRSTASSSSSMPPPPAVPRFNPTSTAPPPRSASTEDHKVQWNAILPLLSACVAAREAFTNASNDVQMYERMLKTQRYTTCPSEERAQAERRLQMLKEAQINKDREFIEKMGQLNKTNWWAIGPKNEGVDVGKVEEIMGFLSKLNGTVKEMHDRIVHPDPADDANTRPLKRRRVSDASVHVPEPSVADALDLETMKDQLNTLVAQIFETERDIVAFRDDTVAHVLEEVQAKMKGTKLDDDDPMGEHPANDVETKMGSLNGELDKAIKKREDVERKVNEWEEQSASNMKEIHDLKSRFDSLEAEAEKDADEVASLTAILEMLKSRPPAAAPVLPMDLTMAALDAPIRETVLSLVQPMVEAMGKDLDNKIAEQDRETVQKLFKKLALTLTYVEGVRKVVAAV